MLKIFLDIDDTVLDFKNTFDNKFPNVDWNNSSFITKLVHRIRKDKDFWTNLPLLRMPDFIPHGYATKRINSKKYTKLNLIKVGLPIRPIYQTVYQLGNKADIIKGRCDVLIDDSISNVIACINKGVPALWIKTEKCYNDPKYTIYELTYKAIEEAYNRCFNEKRRY